MAKHHPDASILPRDLDRFLYRILIRQTDFLLAATVAAGLLHLEQQCQQGPVYLIQQQKKAT